MNVLAYVDNMAKTEILMQLRFLDPLRGIFVTDGLN